MNPLIRAYEAKVDDVNASERSIVAKISTQDVDRYRTVFLSRGCDLTAYNRNRVVLWCHGKDPQRGERPIGKNQWIRVDRGNDPKIIAKTIFNSDDFSQQLFRDYQEGFLNAWSISALPIDYGQPTKEEIRSFPSWDAVQTVYRKYEMLEYSACGVPGNSSCTTINENEVRDLCGMVSRGYYIFPEVRYLVDQMTESDSQDSAPIVERMSESGGMADGGALVDDDGDDEEDDDDADDAKAKKKKKKKAEDRDDDAGDEVEMSADEVDECYADGKPMRSMGDEPDAEVAGDEVARDAEEVEAVVDEPADAVEREAPEAEPVAEADPVEELAALFRRMIQEGRISLDEFRSAPEPEPAPEPVVEPPAPVDPFAGLPPFVGRPFTDVYVRRTAAINAWVEATKKLVRDSEGWLRGQG